MGVGPGATEVRLATEELNKVVELEHEAVEPSTELINEFDSGDVTVVPDAEEFPESLALSRDCFLVGIFDE